MCIYMATKTISIDLEAYEQLRRARLRANESFSRVIKRATWERHGHTCAAFLDGMAGLPVLTEDALDLLDAAQADDAPPEDAWQQR